MAIKKQRDSKYPKNSKIWKNQKNRTNQKSRTASSKGDIPNEGACSLDFKLYIELRACVQVSC